MLLSSKKNVVWPRRAMGRTRAGTDDDIESWTPAPSR
jgi:hypothetical protein